MYKRQGLDNAVSAIESEVKKIENSVKQMADAVERDAIDVINDAKNGIKMCIRDRSASDLEVVSLL